MNAAPLTTTADRTRQVIAFGFLATFMSSFGQTFFLGLFNPYFQHAAGLGTAGVSLLYGIATLASGSLLFWLGGAMDRLSLRGAVVVTLLIFIAGGLFACGTHDRIMLLATFFLLRLGGQGLLTQLAVVSAARNGGRRKGSTIAWATMGVILGEAVLPAGVLALLGFFYWRGLWFAVVALLVVVVLPGLLALSRGIHWRDQPRAHDSTTAAPVGRGALLTDPRFWGGAAILLIPPFMATGFLFEQSDITQLMGWRPDAIGAAFTVFAICRAAGTWGYGHAADRFGAVRMARLHLLPMALAFASLALPLGGASIWCAFAGIGFTNGANSVLGGALWVDLFGTASVGTVRGVFAAAMVLASALAPVTVAGILALGASAGGLGLGFAVYAGLVPLLVGPLLNRAPARAQPAASPSP